MRRTKVRKAIESRWQKEGKREDVPDAIYGDANRPIKIGDLELPCFVLSNQKRVLTLKGMVTALGMKKGSGVGGEGGNRLDRFITGKAISKHVLPGVRETALKPVKFHLPVSREIAYGYEATILADICDAVLSARDAGDLMPHQMHIAKQCEILLRAFARVGIIALVDEATGYQDGRSRDALAKILEAFVAKELRKWVRTFPPEFYKEMFRLRNLTYDGSVKRPSYIGVLTNDVVYSRLAPGVLDELKRKNPTVDSGQRRYKHHQWLTADIGNPKLLQHLAGVIALMKVSTDWDSFMILLNKALPKQMDLPLFDSLEGEPTVSGGADSKSDLLLPS